MLQLTFSYPVKVRVVCNLWNKGYHLQDENHFTVFEDQPPFFREIEEAVSFCQLRGIEPEGPLKDIWG